MAEDIIISIAAFALTFGIVYIIFSTRHRERMTMIDKGIDPKIFVKPRNNNHNGLITWGFLFVGLGIGFFVANMVDTYTELVNVPVYFGSVLLFGGLGLVAAYMITKGAKKTE